MISLEVMPITKWLDMTSKTSFDFLNATESHEDSPCAKDEFVVLGHEYEVGDPLGLLLRGVPGGLDGASPLVVEGGRPEGNNSILRGKFSIKIC
jgi:hypothetical protein